MANDQRLIDALKSFVTEYKNTQKATDDQQAKALSWSKWTFWTVATYTVLTAALFLLALCTLQDGKTNLYFSQRASIVLNDLLAVPLLINNVVVGYAVIPQWENVGNTPATSFSYFNNYWFSRDDLPNGFTTVVGAGKVEGPTSVGPKEILSAGAFRIKETGQPAYFPQACFIDLAQRDKLRYSYVWGWAKYKDTLRPENDRTTRYCWRLFGTLNVKGSVQFNHYLCDEGNCQDGECDKYDRMHAPKMPEVELCQPIPIPPVDTPAQTK
jgi:hypothetical protein